MDVIISSSMTLEDLEKIDADLPYSDENKTLELVMRLNTLITGDVNDDKAVSVNAKVRRRIKRILQRIDPSDKILEQNRLQYCSVNRSTGRIERNHQLIKGQHEATTPVVLILQPREALEILQERSLLTLRVIETTLNQLVNPDQMSKDSIDWIHLRDHLHGIADNRRITNKDIRRRIQRLVYVLSSEEERQTLSDKRKTTVGESAAISEQQQRMMIDRSRDRLQKKNNSLPSSTTVPKAAAIRSATASRTDKIMAPTAASMRIIMGNTSAEHDYADDQTTTTTTTLYCKSYDQCWTELKRATSVIDIESAITSVSSLSTGDNITKQYVKNTLQEIMQSDDAMVGNAKIRRKVLRLLTILSKEEDEVEIEEKSKLTIAPPTKCISRDDDGDDGHEIVISSDNGINVIDKKNNINNNINNNNSDCMSGDNGNAVSTSRNILQQLRNVRTIDELNTALLAFDLRQINVNDDTKTVDNSNACVIIGSSSAMMITTTSADVLKCDDNNSSSASSNRNSEKNRSSCTSSNGNSSSEGSSSSSVDTDDHDFKRHLKRALDDVLTRAEIAESMNSKTRRRVQRITSALNLQDEKEEEEEIAHIHPHPHSVVNGVIKEDRKQTKQTIKATTVPLVLFVGNLHYDTSASDIEQHLKSNGAIDSDSIMKVRIRSDANTGISLGIAFVEVNTLDELYKCIALHHSKLHGRIINIEKSCGGRNKTQRDNKIGEKRTQQQIRMHDAVDRVLSRYEQEGVIKQVHQWGQTMKDKIYSLSPSYLSEVMVMMIMTMMMVMMMMMTMMIMTMMTMMMTMMMMMMIMMLMITTLTLIIVVTCNTTHLLCSAIGTH